MWNSVLFCSIHPADLICQLSLLVIGLPLAILLGRVIWKEYLKEHVKKEAEAARQTELQRTEAERVRASEQYLRDNPPPPEMRQTFAFSWNGDMPTYAVWIPRPLPTETSPCGTSSPRPFHDHDGGEYGEVDVDGDGDGD